MATKNDITGDAIQTDAVTEDYRDGWDRIFGKKKQAEAVLDKLYPTRNWEPTRLNWPVQATYLFCSRAGSYQVDCEILSEERQGKVQISYYDFIMEEPVIEWVEAERVTQAAGK